MPVRAHRRGRFCQRTSSCARLTPIRLRAGRPAGSRRSEPDRRLQRPRQQLPALRHAQRLDQVVPRHRQRDTPRSLCRSRCCRLPWSSGDTGLFRPRRGKAKGEPFGAAPRRRACRAEHHHERRQRPAVPRPRPVAERLRLATGGADELTGRPPAPVGGSPRISRSCRDDANVPRGHRCHVAVPGRRYGNPSGSHSVARAA